MAPASTEVQAESEARGDWQALLDAGAIALPAGCGPCIGLGKGLLQDNEVGISATNRNFRGRMGSPSADAYLASPTVVAASAIRGYISSPTPVAAGVIAHSMEEFPPPTTESAPGSAALLEGFNASATGRLLMCLQDNINTDGIYPGEQTSASWGRRYDGAHLSHPPPSWPPPDRQVHLSGGHDANHAGGCGHGELRRDICQPGAAR